LRIETQLAGGGSTVNPDCTIGQVATAFLHDFEELVQCKSREATTLRMYDSRVRLHLLLFDIAKVKVAELGGPDCTDYANDLERERNHVMASRVFRTFRQILDFRVSRGWLISNPSKGTEVRTPGERVSKEKVEAPPKSQVRALIAAAASHALCVRYGNSGNAREWRETKGNAWQHATKKKRRPRNASPRAFDSYFREISMVAGEGLEPPTRGL
jgi:hypothetical protein